MNTIDVIILALLALLTFAGFRQGFVVEVATILGSIAALAAAKAAYRPVRHTLGQLAPHSSWLTAISYLLVFLAVLAVIVTLARMVRRGLRLLFLGWADRLGGAILGLLQGAILVELLLYLGKRLPSHDLHRLVAHSQLAPTFVQIVPNLNKLFPHLPYH